jgi:hypothetical protein
MSISNRAEVRIEVYDQTDRRNHEESLGPSEDET